MICHSGCSLDPLIILGRCSVLSHLVKSYYLSEYVTEPAIFIFFTICQNDSFWDYICYFKVQ